MIIHLRLLNIFTNLLELDFAGYDNGFAWQSKDTDNLKVLTQ